MKNAGLNCSFLLILEKIYPHKPVNPSGSVLGRYWDHQRIISKLLLFLCISKTTNGSKNSFKILYFPFSTYFCHTPVYVLQSSNPLPTPHIFLFQLLLSFLNFILQIPKGGFGKFQGAEEGKRVSWPSQHPLQWAGGKTGPHGSLWITPTLKWHDGWMFWAVDSDSKPSFCETFEIHFEKVSFPL